MVFINRQERIDPEALKGVISENWIFSGKSNTEKNNYLIP